MNEKEALKIMDIGICPICIGELDLKKTGILSKKYSIKCLDCNGFWNDYNEIEKMMHVMSRERITQAGRLKSKDYLLIKYFASAYIDIPLENNEVEKLYTLLKAKDNELSYQFFEKILKNEILQLKIVNFESKIGYNYNMLVDDVIYSFVQNIPIVKDDLVNRLQYICMTVAIIDDAEIDIQIDDSYNILIKPSKSLSTFWRKHTDDELKRFLREREMRSNWIRSGRNSRWEIPLTSRILYEYDEQYSLLKLLLEKYEIQYDGNKLPYNIYQKKKELELKFFEERLLSQEYRTIDINDIDNFNGLQFESFLKELFTKMGYTVQNIKSSHDQGADLILTQFGEKISVQAKRYSSKVTNSAIQEVVGSIKFYKANSGMVVTTNEFTPSARELAQANNIVLINRSKLIELLNQYF